MNDLYRKIVMNSKYFLIRYKILKFLTDYIVLFFKWETELQKFKKY